tara:strand:+ start:367 stop:696 length:330 start_codon:yes stop_codon:yes gene_type:complete
MENNTYPGSLSEKAFRFECHKLVLNEEDLQRRIDNVKEFIPYRPRLKTFSYSDYNLGRLLKCPKCGHVSISWHFSWSGDVCLGCGKEVDKKEYLYEVKNFKGYKVQEVA